MKSTILTKGDWRVVLNWEREYICVYGPAFCKIVRFENLKQLTPDKIVAFYRHLGYTAPANQVAGSWRLPVTA